MVATFLQLLRYGKTFAYRPGMPRKLLQRTNILPYHLTGRVNNKEEFHVPLARMWALIGDECLYLTVVYQVQFHALVLMPNHFHILMTVPEGDLGQAMNFFMSSVTRMSNLLSGRSGRLFGGPYYWSLVNNSRYFGHVYKYVYRNPVRAKLCSRVEEYPFSTLSGLLGSSPLPFPLYFTKIGMEIAFPTAETHLHLNWLNKPFPKDAEVLIQKGLRKRLFVSVPDPKSRIPSEILSQLL